MSVVGEASAGRDGKCPDTLMTIMALANTFCQGLACRKVFDGRSMPDRAPILDAAQVATPHLVRIGDRQISQQVLVEMMECGDDAVP